MQITGDLLTVPRLCGYELEYSYNPGGEITSQFVPGIYNTLTDTYDSVGHITQIASNLVDANHPATLATINSYTPWDSISQMTYGNGLVETSSFNNRMQPTESGDRRDVSKQSARKLFRPETSGAAGSRLLISFVSLPLAINHPHFP